MANNQTNGKAGTANQGTKSDNQGGNSQSDTRTRGFASMDPELQRQIASQGGRAAHASGNAHEFTSEEAREAGKLSHSGGNRQSASGNTSSRSSTGGNKQSDADAGAQQKSGGANDGSGSGGSRSR